MIPDHEEQVVETAKFIVEQFNKTGVSGITLGDRDTLLGAPTLKALHKDAKFPFLVANLLDAETGKPMFDDHIIKTVDGVKVGLFGVTMTGAERRPTDGSPMAWRVDNPIKVAGEQVALLKSKGAEVIVALAHLSQSELKNLAQQVPGITAVLAGSGTRAMTHPDTESGVFICEAHSKGKYLSVLTLHVWKDRQPNEPFVDRFKREGLKLEVQKLEARLSSYQRLVEKKEAEVKKAPETPKTAAGPRRARSVGADYYKKQLVRMRAEKAGIELELEELEEVDPSANYVVYELAPVKKSLADQASIGKDVLAFRARYPKLKPGARSKQAPASAPKRTKLKSAPKR
mgnify:CR=1 FL=1